LAAYERLEHQVSGSADRLARDLFDATPRVHGLVAEADGDLVGYALFYPTYSSFRTAPALWLEDIYVEPRVRGLGVGRRLLGAVASFALARGCSRLGWIVLDWNEPALDFYRREGARPAPDEGWLQYGLDHDGLRAVAESWGGEGSG